MIHYVTLHTFPTSRFLASAGRPLADRIRVLRYPELLAMARPPGGAWIFADLERLDRRQTRAAARVWEALARRDDVRLLNHPARSLRRAALLRRLSAEGVNRFRAYPAWRVPRTARFPLLLRVAREHRGAWGPLLFDRAQLHRARLRALRRVHWGARVPLRELLAVEWLDTSDANGVYRKYSAFRVGDAIVARHLFFARTWQVKHGQLADPALLAEEMDFVTRNPHAEALRAVFDAAGIQFGRVDYALLDGRPQIWEINTNAMLTRESDAEGPRAPVLDVFVGRFLPALEALDS